MRTLFGSQRIFAFRRLISSNTIEKEKIYLKVETDIFFCGDYVRSFGTLSFHYL